MTTLHNSNGFDYEVIALCDFNKVDADYYKDSWQNYRYALLKDSRQYIVASYVGETGWGNGSYFDNENDARKDYETKVKKYMA